MLINGIPANQKLFAYDSDYKIYLLDDIDDVAEAVRLDYQIKNIELLESTYEESCELRFISNWKLTVSYAAQYEKAVFIYQQEL